MEGGVRESTLVPDSVMESVNRTLAGVVEMEAHLLHFLSLSDPDVLSEMPPLQRAQALAALLLLARATSTLFTCTESSVTVPVLFFVLICNWWF
jgi:exosome complex protein LRP1